MQVVVDVVEDPHDFLVISHGVSRGGPFSAKDPVERNKHLQKICFYHKVTFAEAFHGVLFYVLKVSVNVIIDDIRAVDPVVMSQLPALKTVKQVVIFFAGKKRYTQDESGQ